MTEKLKDSEQSQKDETVDELEFFTPNLELGYLKYCVLTFCTIIVQSKLVFSNHFFTG